MTGNARKSGRREMILEEARELFIKKGYENTTLEQIGKVCGLNKASLYYYFRNKEEIYIQVLLTEAEKYIGSLQCEVQNYRRTEEKIKQYLLSRIRRYANALSVSQLSIENLYKVEPAFLHLFQDIKDREIDFLQRILDEGVAKGDIEAVDSRALADSLFVISDALKHERMIQERPYPNSLYNYTKVEDQLRLIIQLVFKGLNLN